MTVFNNYCTFASIIKRPRRGIFLRSAHIVRYYNIEFKRTYKYNELLGIRGQNLKMG
jgi:hypothetical protein